MTTPPPVWIVDQEHWPRAFLRAEFIERGHDARGFESLADALVTLLMKRNIRPGILIIDLARQPFDPAKLSAFRQRGWQVMGIGGSVESGTEVAARFPWAAFVSRPITLGAIADLVDRLATTAGRRVHPPPESRPPR
jgi:DNA-binding NtrC family response regulator